MAGYSEVVVFCDLCTRKELMSFVEGDAPRDHVALERLRERLVSEGWSVDTGDDYCRQCVAEREIPSRR